MKLGYCRTSTFEQVAGLEDQVKALETEGVDRLYKEHASAVGERPEFLKVLELAREDDTIIVTKLDRLARSMQHLTDIIADLEKRGVHLKILNMGLDTSTSTGRLMINVLGSVAEFERDMMLERQRIGIEAAKAQGKYRGRKPTFSVEKVETMKKEGMTISQIAEKFGVSRQAIYKRLSQDEKVSTMQKSG